MNAKGCNGPRLSTQNQRKAQTIGQKFSFISSSSHPITSSNPPFVQGTQVRPRNPWHIWRQYPVIVEECYSASAIWLIKVRVSAKQTFSETVLASDFERVVEWREIETGINA